jgi:hypothetical protein
MPGQNAANPMRQCANAKARTRELFRVYSLVALQCGPARKRYSCVTRRQLTRYAMSWRQQAPRPIQCRSCPGSIAAPRYSSTQPAAGAKSPCGRLQARPRVRLQLFAAALARPSPG